MAGGLLLLGLAIHRPWKRLAVLLVVAVVLGGLGLGGWALWANRPAHAGASDRWVNVMTGFGAAAAGAGVVAGGVLAARYGRRASVSISATAEPLPDGGFIVAARPIVRGVGIFRVKFHGPNGALIRVREVYLSTTDSGMDQGEFWEQAAVFGEQYAEPNEELPTTVLFRLYKPDPAVVGWVVWVGIEAPTRFLSTTTSWADRIFVPRPKN